MGIGRSDLLVVNKIDLAPYVDVSLESIHSDLEAVRGPLPFIFTNLKKSEGMDYILNWIEKIITSTDKNAVPLWSQNPTLKSGISKDHHNDHNHSSSHNQHHSH